MLFRSGWASRAVDAGPHPPESAPDIADAAAATTNRPAVTAVVGTAHRHHNRELCDPTAEAAMAGRETLFLADLSSCRIQNVNLPTREQKLACTCKRGVNELRPAFRFPMPFDTSLSKFTLKKKRLSSNQQSTVDTRSTLFGPHSRQKKPSASDFC